MVELVIGEIIVLARRLVEKTVRMHDGIWDKSAAGSHEIRGRTLGIVGYGNIGSQLSVVAEAVGLRVIFFDVTDRLAHGNARRMPSLEALLAEADVVSLHVDGRPGNAGFFGAEHFDAMKPRSLFINAARGMVVDNDALRERVLSGHIAGAALDVFPIEPKAQGDPFESPLRGLDNVILTPHVGGSTQEAQEEIGQFVADKLVTYVEDGSTALSVNLPDRAGDPPALRRVPARAPARQRPRRAGTGEPGARGGGGQHPRPVAGHPGRAGVRRHRRLRAPRRHRAGAPPVDAAHPADARPARLTCRAWTGRSGWPRDRARRQPIPHRA